VKRLDKQNPDRGLGLSIAADLASLYGGQLSLDQSAKGGLRAVLKLPPCEVKRTLP
jgi:signal transduction histidine kinase